ncbi:MAG TPA: hypothetical protein DCK95_04215 [Anaerolineaceae bacterium]|nr:hypothetical protein [Anaerolineaceae bacterium]
MRNHKTKFLLKRLKAYNHIFLIGLILICIGVSLFFTLNEVNQRQALEAVQGYWRTDYDILVRPSGSTFLVDDSGNRLIEPNFLSGQQGGISDEQLELINFIDGIEVAAPVAFLGYFPLGLLVEGEKVNDDPANAEAPWLVYKDVRTFTMNDGWQDAVSSDTLYTVESHTDAFSLEPNTGAVSFVGENGEEYLLPQSITSAFANPSGGKNKIRLSGKEDWENALAYYEREQEQPFYGHTYNGLFNLYLPVAAIDPQAEQVLLGLEEALVEGRYLSSADTYKGPNNTYSYLIPVLINENSFQNITINIKTYRLTDPAQQNLSQSLSNEGLSYLEGMQSELLGEETTTLHDYFLQYIKIFMEQEGTVGGTMWTYLRPSPVQYTQTEGQQAALSISPVGTSRYGPILGVSSEPAQGAYRRALIDDFVLVENHRGYTFGFTPVGIYDLSDLQDSTINQVPQELYSAPYALLREDKDGNVLQQGVTIIPTNNPLGYLSQPPVVLTTLPAAKFLAQRDDYISAVRVRVAGVETAGEEAQQKIEKVARQIEEATGLQVDITLGSSPQTMLVDVQGSDTVEALGKLEELWVRQLVGITLQRDFTRFDTLLFAAMFFSFGVFIYSSAALNLTGRQGEIGVLKTIGWKDKRILGYLLSEALLLALITGCIAFVATTGITHSLEIPIAFNRSGLIFPVMLGLFALGTALPFWQAARRSPLSLLGLGELRVGKGTTSKLDIQSLSSKNISMQRSRFTTATLGLIPAFLALILFFFITVIMAGELSGSLLGQHIQILIQPYHYGIVAIILLVCQLILMNITTLNINKRQAEIGVLLTAGWKPSTILFTFLKETLYSALGSALLAALLAIGLLSLVQGGFQIQFLWAIPLGLFLAGVMDLIAMLYPRHLIRRGQTGRLFHKKS